MQIQLKRLNDAFHFEARNEEGNVVQMDAGQASGGEGKGASPMQLLLMALAGCSGIDIVMILKKQKQEILDFTATVDAEREQEGDAKVYKKIHVHFRLKGNIEKEKAQRAVQLSMDKYCSVAKTLEKTAEITYSVWVNE